MKQTEKNSFRLSLDKLPQVHIKKNSNFYNHIGNLWNSKYLSSPKISKYYIDPNESYLSGPAGPTSISLIESTERDEVFKNKAAKSKIESRQRLLDRKKERQKIQQKSKQLTVNFTDLVQTRQKSTPQRPFTQTFGINQVQIMLNRFKSLSNRDKKEKLEPIMLTQKNYSENDSILRENDGRFSNRESTIRVSKYIQKKVDKRSIFLKNSAEEVKDERISPKRIHPLIDQIKVKEILEELEEFERQYAERITNRN